MGSSAASRTDLLRAVDLALAGDWDGAHEIVQQDDNHPAACCIHATLHKIESDEANSRYWRKRADRDFDAHADPKAELDAVRASLGG